MSNLWLCKGLRDVWLCQRCYWSSACSCILNRMRLPWGICIIGFPNYFAVGTFAGNVGGGRERKKEDSVWFERKPQFSYIHLWKWPSYKICLWKQAKRSFTRLLATFHSNSCWWLCCPCPIQSLKATQVQSPIQPYSPFPTCSYRVSLVETGPLVSSFCISLKSLKKSPPLP